MKQRRYSLLIAAGVVFLAVGIAVMVWMLYAVRTANRFAALVETNFYAASMVNANGIHTDEDKAVIAEYAGNRAVVHPKNYAALELLLTQEMAAALFGEMKKENALCISFCGMSDMYVAPDERRDGIFVEWTVQDRRYYVRIKGNDIWERVRLFAMEGVGGNRNIPL